jgi:hypothetical protein
MNIILNHKWSFEYTAIVEVFSDDATDKGRETAALSRKTTVVIHFTFQIWWRRQTSKVSALHHFKESSSNSEYLWSRKS